MLLFAQEKHPKEKSFDSLYTLCAVNRIITDFSLISMLTARNQIDNIIYIRRSFRYLKKNLPLRQDR